MTIEVNGKELEINESKVFATEENEKNVIVNGIWYAQDDASNYWLQIGTEEQYNQEH